MKYSKPPQGEIGRRMVKARRSALIAAFVFSCLATLDYALLCRRPDDFIGAVGWSVLTLGCIGFGWTWVVNSLEMGNALFYQRASYILGYGLGPAVGLIILHLHRNSVSWSDWQYSLPVDLAVCVIGAYLLTWWCSKQLGDELEERRVTRILHGPVKGR